MGRFQETSSQEGFREVCFFSPKQSTPISLEKVTFFTTGAISSNNVDLSRKSLGTCGVGKQRDQSFFVWAIFKIVSLNMRRIVAKLSLLCEEDWDEIHNFDSTGFTILALGEFMKKTQFRSSTLRVVKASVDVVNGKSDVGGEGRANDDCEIGTRICEPLIGIGLQLHNFFCD